MTEKIINTLLLWTAIIILGMSCQLTLDGSSYNLYEEAAQRSSVMGDRIHGYLQVRPGAHLFYQLFYANGTKLGAYSKPLFIWIQGGPGLAASGIGTFAEIGPLDLYFEPRNHTWVKRGNVLFIDHPVGTGFSFVTQESLYAKTDHEMALDLSTAIKMFLRTYKIFRKTPSYIVGQSYGGKICPRLALYLYRANKSEGVQINLKGIGIGGGWVNPSESLLMRPELMFLSGATDTKTYLEARRIAKKLATAIETENYKDAFELWHNLNIILFQQCVINLSNYMKPSIDVLWLANVMNYYVKPTLSKVDQSMVWEHFSEEAHFNVYPDFLTSSYTFLEILLNESNLKVVVYNGNLDVITPVSGASNWVHKLNWTGAADFSKASINPIKGERNGYYKVWGNLSFWSVLGAGHWVPAENPEAMEHILNYLTSDV